MPAFKKKVPSRLLAPTTETKKSKMGRPSLYTPQIAAEICERLAEGESLRSICKEHYMPTVETVRVWVHEKSDFSVQYRQAREFQAETFVDELIDIADSAHDRDSAAAAKVRVDTRKWVVSKILSKKYGDKIELSKTPVEELSLTFNIEPAERFSGYMGVEEIDAEAHCLQ